MNITDNLAVTTPLERSSATVDHSGIAALEANAHMVEAGHDHPQESQVSGSVLGCRLFLQTIQSRGHRVECRPRRTLAQRAQEFMSESPPVRKLVANVPTPRCDHRENELPAIIQQSSVNARVVLADRLGNMGEIELDGSTAACLEVDEQR